MTDTVGDPVQQPVIITPARVLVSQPATYSIGAPTTSPGEAPGVVVVDPNITMQTPGVSFCADVTIEEDGTDELMITQHPVEIGATITDHAFKNPARITIRVGWTNSSAQAAGDENYVAAIYAQLLDIQAQRLPFSTQTGKRLYANMLFRSLRQTTDEKTETTLMIVAELQEIILVATRTTNVPSASVQANPANNAAILNQGTKQPVPAGS